ncbi:uncharacterized protein [Arachis hypogaea]|uniref:uncharacterized protein n=1 Tax=Arachis hypogaea TaxID=3818 RepID=UPI003B22482D
MAESLFSCSGSIFNSSIPTDERREAVEHNIGKQANVTLRLPHQPLLISPRTLIHTPVRTLEPPRAIEPSATPPSTPQHLHCFDASPLRFHHRRTLLAEPHAEHHRTPGAYPCISASVPPLPLLPAPLLKPPPLGRHPSASEPPCCSIPPPLLLHNPRFPYFGVFLFYSSNSITIILAATLSPNPPAEGGGDTMTTPSTPHDREHRGRCYILSVERLYIFSKCILGFEGKNGLRKWKESIQSGRIQEMKDL